MADQSSSLSIQGVVDGALKPIGEALKTVESALGTVTNIQNMVGGGNQGRQDNRSGSQSPDLNPLRQTTGSPSTDAIETADSSAGAGTTGTTAAPGTAAAANTGAGTAATAGAGTAEAGAALGEAAELAPLILL